MTESTSIHGHEIIELVTNHPGGIPLSQLTETVSECYGCSPTFHTCSAENMDLESLLVFLQERNKVHVADGLVFPTDSPACDH